MKSFKITALILVIISLFTMTGLAGTVFFTIPLSGANSASPSENLIYLGNEKSEGRIHKEITASTVVAQRIKGDGAISSVAVKSPSYDNNIGELTITVYKWTGSYSSSVSSKALATKTFKNYNDNILLSVSIPKPTEDHVLVTAGDSVERVGVWIDTSATHSNQSTFVDGTEVTGSLVSAYTIAEKQEVPEVPEENDTAGVTFNPYEYIEPGSRLEVHGFTEQINTDHYDGDDVMYGLFNVPASGCYAEFGYADFGDTPPKSASFRIYNMGSLNFSEVQIRLDSPTGPVLAGAKIYYDLPDYKTRSYWQELTSEIYTPVTGKRKLFLVSRGTGFIIGKFKFNHEQVEKTGWDKQLADYQEVPDSSLMNTYSDTWVATDILGRKLVDYDTAGPKREGKEVVLFYWTSTHEQTTTRERVPFNNQLVVDTYPGDINEIKNDPDHIAWGSPAYWNESIYGYYSSYDRWVIRKQLELFSAAGVDAISFDCSNRANTYAGGYMKVVEEIHKMRVDGYDVPGVTFILPWFANQDTADDLENLYLGMYASGLYADSWYYWNGKPVLMAYPGGVFDQPTGSSELDGVRAEINEFFTFRPAQPKYKAGQTVENQWPWLEVYPQHGFVPTKDGGYECVAVSVAQNSNDEVESYTAMNGEGVYGRSYTYKDRFSKLSDSSCLYGYNFQEQWDHALEIDPKMIFITGWNEWTAGHNGSGTDVIGAYVDTWIDEYSRDAEPTKGQLKDNYYLQMANNIRRFKGVSPTPQASEAKTINISGSFSQWEGVGPDYHGFKGAGNRDFTGANTVYTNNTGRNDIVLSKVARDSDNLYFYAKTTDALTPSTDKNWMRLYINTDRSYKTGWEGYDLIINRVSPENGKLVVEKYVGKDNLWRWEKVSTADFKVEGNQLMIALPKSIAGISGSVDIEFKWHDNGVTDGDAMDFYANGDSAPVGRFAYRYVEDLSSAKKTVDEPSGIEQRTDFILRKDVVMAIGSPVAYAKGLETKIDISNDSVVPVIINDKTLVPIRFISEGLGATVTWNEQTSSATITLSDKKLVIKEGSDTMRAVGATYKLQTPAQTINDRMFVPLRDITEALGMVCYWEDPGLIIIGTNVTGRILAHQNIVPEYMARYGMAY